MASSEFERYVFHAKLAGKPVCVVCTVENGFYADALEKCGIWKQQENTVHGDFVWKALYPMCIQYGDSRWDLEVGDQFTLGAK